MKCHRGKRAPETEAVKNERHTQKQAAKNFIHKNQYRDLTNQEIVNRVSTREIEAELKNRFVGVGIFECAIPKNAEHGLVTDIPNVYHFELFPRWNEPSITVSCNFK
jgi:hypothetical protein